MENFQTPSPSSEPTEGGEPVPPTNRGGSEFEVSRPADGNGWGHVGDAPAYFKDGRQTINLLTIDSVVSTLNRAYEINERLLKEVRELREEQISGDDGRLDDFWEKAQELADRAGHCQVFDEIAEALGGPRREREFTVSFTYTHTVTVNARDEESAEEYARDLVESTGTSVSDMYEESAYIEEA